jgi:hypothetical protein
MKSLYGSLILFLLTVSQSFASHVLGGQITASHLTGQTYKIIVNVYMDANNAAGAIENAASLLVCFGDGNTADAPTVSTVNLDGGVALIRYEKTHSYSTSGSFQISAGISSRTSDYLNLPSDGSGKFFLWTVINTEFSNSTPILGPAGMTAGVRQPFVTDLSPAVQDTDSISFRLQSVSSPSPGTCGVRSLEKAFLYPNDLTKTGTFKIDNKSKKLIWTAPEVAGKYTYAFVVDEWRNGIVISQSYYERTIHVTDRPGNTVAIPEYEPAGALITAVINPGTSPESQIMMNAYPVPATDFLTFKVYSQKKAVITVRLVNLKGVVVRETSSQNPEVEFESMMDVSQLSPGLYILQSGNGVETVSKKVLR